LRCGAGFEGGCGDDGWLCPMQPPIEDLAVLAGVYGVLVEVLENRNAKLTAQVADLTGRLEKLERLVSRNSGNSEMPPSADDLPGKVAPVSPGA
jgi:hypothetical protein